MTPSAAGCIFFALMNILGLNFLHANASAAVFVDGSLVAAAEEERFSRIKYSAGIPFSAIEFCLRKANLEFRDIDVITYARSTNTRIVNNDQIHFQDHIYKIASLYDRYRINLKLINFKEIMAQRFGIPVERLVFKLREEDHHISHLLSGYFCSPFEEALLLSCDAFGDFISVKAGIARGPRIQIERQVQFPHSLGLFYTMVTQFLGFHGYGEESKVMGLSTFGYPEFTDRLRSIISFENNSLELNLKYFNHQSGVGTTWSQQTPDITMLYNDNLSRLIGEQRHPGEEITSRHQNIASSLQHLTEEIVFDLIDELHSKNPVPQLVFTGGLAYNALLNSRILSETPVERIYVPPAPGNSGLCVGSALSFMGPSVRRSELTHAFWGSDYTSEDILKALQNTSLGYAQSADPASAAAELLASGKSVAWFQGRMEFGPRSLGSRSLLLSTRSRDPLEIKDRDQLKPFGISILEERTGEFFQEPHPSPFMSLMGRTRPRARREFEKVLLNEYCRYQTVGEDNPLYKVLEAYRKRIGLPFLINTSLNPEGEPIIESVEQLLDNFERMRIDAAVIGEFVVLPAHPPA
ncbi:MAG: hypothetical protein HY645_06785 [Acidobacteria bacterium]|nr:hypothetical protein [Acidobacteriota bacterium]